MSHHWARATAVGAMSVIIGASTLFAHHSDASFDKDHLTTIKGSVTQHLLINPHQVIKIKVADADGQIKLWVLQGGPVAGMEGWTKDTIKPGDQVTVTGFANRDGSPGMHWIRIVRADGTDVPMTAFRRDQIARLLRDHGKDLSPQENEVFKKMLADSPQSGRPQTEGY